MLSPVLSGEKAYEDIVIHNDEAWYADNRVSLQQVVAKALSHIDREAQNASI